MPSSPQKTFATAALFVAGLGCFAARGESDPASDRKVTFAEFIQIKTAMEQGQAVILFRGAPAVIVRQDAGRGCPAVAIHRFAESEQGRQFQATIASISRICPGEMYVPARPVLSQP